MLYGLLFKSILIINWAFTAFKGVKPLDIYQIPDFLFYSHKVNDLSKVSNKIFTIDFNKKG